MKFRKSKLRNSTTSRPDIQFPSFSSRINLELTHDLENFHQFFHKLSLRCLALPRFILRFLNSTPDGPFDDALTNGASDTTVFSLNSISCGSCGADCEIFTGGAVRSGNWKSIFPSSLRTKNHNLLLSTRSNANGSTFDAFSYLVSTFSHLPNECGAGNGS